MLTGVAVRLVGGNSYNKGRVEVNYNGEWGTVCNDGWGDTNAGVVCRQLGFGSSGLAVRSSGFGQASGPVLLDKIACDGSESMLERCEHSGVGAPTRCTHSSDAGVRCLHRQGCNLLNVRTCMHMLLMYIVIINVPYV